MSNEHQQEARAIHVTGIVQGVGFRPRVYTLALEHGLCGWVRNTSAGVDIHVEGDTRQLNAFILALQSSPPPLARIEGFNVQLAGLQHLPNFEIRSSAAQAGVVQPVPPELALCADCRRELQDPTDRRYRYAFLNCTNCGPRFSIIHTLPYDRPQTTMRAFEMCAACAAEYHDPSNRRFHAQPIACPTCGPQLWLEEPGNPAARAHSEAALQAALRVLRAGDILAIKGLGGFHLAVDATQPGAVEALRQRKHRPHKPFALMMANLSQVGGYCRLSEEEGALLASPASPIVLLPWQEARDVTPLAAAVAPGQRTLGVMLPYTPLHTLLLEHMPPLVMTSGNPRGEPMVTDNATARVQLAELADAFLLHNRDIHLRVDDSVVRVFRGATLPMRRARGYAPYPIRLPQATPGILAVGAEMKNTFCLAQGQTAFLSHHIGTLGNYASLQAFESSIQHFEQLFQISPTLLVHDLHPDYLSTRYAQQRAEAEGLPRLAVQHHHAHLASCLAEQGHLGTEPVLGVCFDGTGYGPDGTLWGGEFLIVDYQGYQRAAHFAPMPLPGGDAATRNPARIAFAYLLACGLEPGEDLPPLTALTLAEQRLLRQQLAKGINTPLTSSVGRLFDAVSALLGVCQATSYEGQAAIDLEAQCDPDETALYTGLEGLAGLNPAALLAPVLADWRAGVPIGKIAARFHHSLAEIVAQVSVHLANAHGLSEVALSGGVFQNVRLLEATLRRLEAAGLRVYIHRQVPLNDGGLALGQAALAAHYLNHTR
ncbi:MAG: carbamoyltransferase HypF [Anaerolineae bacterium]|nr:carbamoyltransferase HypF [Anaerolineae bacterium]